MSSSETSSPRTLPITSDSAAAEDVVVISDTDDEFVLKDIDIADDDLRLDREVSVDSSSDIQDVNNNDGHQQQREQITKVCPFI